jgi:DNA-binding IclR family transcriptional regulator
LLSMLKRRPCSLNDICSGLGINRNEAIKSISNLQNRGIIQTEDKDGTVFFKTSS